MDPFSNLNKIKIDEQRRFDMSFDLFGKLFVHVFNDSIAEIIKSGKVDGELAKNLVGAVAKDMTEVSFKVVDIFIKDYLEEYSG